MERFTLLIQLAARGGLTAMIVDFVILLFVVTCATVGGFVSLYILRPRRRVTGASRTSSIKAAGAFVFGAVTVSSVAWWMLSPYYYIFAIEDCKQAGDGYPQWAEDRLVAMGSRAVDPVISELAGRNVFERGSGMLTRVLWRIGQPAHLALLRAVDSERSASRRIGWIYALVEDFHDYSRLHLWIDQSVESNKLDRYLWSIVTRAFPDAPVMADGHGRISAEFIEWYRNAKASGKITTS